MDYFSEIQKQRRATAEAALVIATELEAGRAVSPFQEKLTQLSGNPVIPVRAAVISPQPEVLQALLSEIIGHDYNVCKVVVPSRLGFSEVLLQERGFLLDTGAGAREFDDAGSFLTALQQTHALQQTEGDLLEPLRLKLKGPTHSSGLCLLVPHSLEAMQRKPALLSTLADQADWVFLAGSAEATFTPEERTTVQVVLDNVTGLQNVLQPAAADAPAPAERVPEEWWKHWKVGLSLGLVRLGTELLRKRLALLTAPDSELRLYLVESRLLRQMDMTLALMQEETQQEQRKLGNRLTLAREGLTDRDGQPEMRKTAEGIRQKFADELDSLVKAGEREAKASLQADGDANRQLREASATLSVDDIEQTEGDTAIKLTLSIPAAARLTQAVLGLARHRLSTDLRQLTEGLECSVRDAKRAIEAATGARPSISVELPDEAGMWDTISSLARPEIRYRGEMPRATLGARFNAARQVIMGVMILGTILGGATVLTGDTSGGQGIRTTLAALMIPLLVVGFLWTYVSFRKKETQTLEKELEKLQDGVLAELRRVLQDLHREQMTLLGSSVQKLQRSVQQQMDGTFEKLDKQRQRDADETRRRQTEQQRSIDQRIARMKQFGGQLATLQSNLKEAERIRAKWLAAWIERFNQGKV
ncbi:hypothetical protein Verru16b_02874 [Lacunisphaera limnophila]|uniref:Uncharacterized protein n=1 Tax=Lacunisphaera limnophila TaxID=1838286 RepID=A0A1D8AY06_9BACT|nr:hypothetical protein [Lacunisphaera limnophila]AOS45786.1 hypothetical protein Verru16b_02874 [Lacunisphaera limnophila]